MRSSYDLSLWYVIYLCDFILKNLPCAFVFNGSLMELSTTSPLALWLPFPTCPWRIIFTLMIVPLTCSYHWDLHPVMTHLEWLPLGVLLALVLGIKIALLLRVLPCVHYTVTFPNQKTWWQSRFLLLLCPQNSINHQVVLMQPPKHFLNLFLISIPTSTSFPHFPDILQLSAASGASLNHPESSHWNTDLTTSLPFYDSALLTGTVSVP